MQAIPQITAIVATLPSTDLERTSRFYTEKLGFEEAGRHGDYLLLRLAGHELHFWLTTYAELGESCSCYLRVRGIAALYQQYAAQPDLLHPQGALQARAWGMTEFYILDPDGNLLKFGELTA